MKVFPELVEGLVFLRRKLLEGVICFGWSGDRDLVESWESEAVLELREGRFPVLGGWGKAAMLTARRRVLSGLPGARPTGGDPGAVTPEEGLDDWGMANAEGRGEVEGMRSFEGFRVDEGALGFSECARMVFFFDFETGNGGRAVVGGFVEGRDGCGIVEVMFGSLV